MKLLFVISNLDLGGAQKSLVNLLNSLSPDKNEVDLLVLSPDKMQLKQDIKLPVNFYTLDKPVSDFFLDTKKSIKYLWKSSFVLALKRLLSPLLIRINSKKVYPEQVIWLLISDYININLKEYDVAIAYCQGLPTYYVCDKVRAKKKIAWMHSDATKQIHDVKFSLNKYEKFHKIFCVSDKAVEQFQYVFPSIKERVSVYHNIINPKEIKEKANEEVDIVKYKDYSYIVTVGRLHYQKGYFLAVDVCKKLVDKGFKIKWLVVGTGELKNELEKYVITNHLSEHFIFLGAKANPYPYMRLADIYVQPSLSEGYCITLTEAKILKKVIVTTDFSGASEQIRSGYNGIISSIDSLSLFNAISDLIKMPEEYNKIHDNILQESFLLEETNFDKILQE